MRKALEVLSDAWKHRRKLDKKRTSNTDFLPAALEILEKPPSPAGRILGWSLVALFAIFVAWACIGEVDVVAVAEGKIIPGSRIKQIQPMQAGVINKIFVNEGQVVKQGEALIELDQTLTGADQKRLQNEVRFYQLSKLRQVVQKKLMEKEINLERIPDITVLVKQEAEKLSYQLDASNLELQTVMANQAWQELVSQLSTLASKRQSKHSELEAVKANIEKYQSTLPLVTKRVDALQELHAKGMGAETQLLELQENQITQKQNLVSEQARKRQIEAELEEIEQNRLLLINTRKKENFEAIDELDRSILSAQEELNKASELYAKQILSAPVAGKVQQLQVYTVGGVVSEGQVLMQIVPQEGFLEVEAVLPNKDIGFVNSGQFAEIKVHTFPFTKYGVIAAEVTDVTADAIESESQGLVYKIRLRMQENKLWVDKKWVELIPGMAVSAEVKIKKRRLIEFFTAPLLRYKDESARER